MELAIALLALYGVVTQIVIPAVNNTKLFPAFRNEGKLKEEITSVEQSLLEKQIAAELQHKIDVLNDVQPTKGNTNV
jgi:hypothetical protein